MNCIGIGFDFEISWEWEWECTGPSLSRTSKNVGCSVCTKSLLVTTVSAQQAAAYELPCFREWLQRLRYRRYEDLSGVRTACVPPYLRLLLVAMLYGLTAYCGVQYRCRDSVETQTSCLPDGRLYGCARPEM